jgi:hypothetical protein
VDAAVAGSRATPALQAGTAAERRQRRMERRAVAMPAHALHWIPLARMDGSRDGRKRRSVVGGWPACEDVATLLMPPHLLAAVTAKPTRDQ